MEFEVYICKIGSEIVYVGSGKLNRHKHCNSGTSHVYEMNKLHFNGVLFTVEVTHFATREVALEQEIKLIRSYSPKYNTQYTEKDIRRNLGSDKISFRKALKDSYNKMKVKLSKEKFSKLSEEFLKAHSIQRIREEGVIIKYPKFYYKVGCNTLGNLVKRDRVFVSKTSVEFFSILEATYKQHYGVDNGIRFE